jgi:FimV-like protein
VLNQEHNVLQGKLAQLGQILSVLNQEVTQLNQQISSAQKQLSTTLTPAEQQHQAANAIPVGSSFTKSIEGSSTTQYVLYAILVLLIIIIMMLIPRRGGSKVQSVTAGSSGSASFMDDDSDNDTSDEYDFMNSDEAIPAKLDLARAYMAMEDYKSASKVLSQVKKNGNEEQKAEAKEMFDKIPKK